LAKDAAAADASAMSKEEKKALKGKSHFAEVMRTLCRLASSYRRCY
jgi:hypothetical protein